MSSDTYINCEPLHVTNGDIGIPAVVQLRNSECLVANLCRFPNCELTATLTAKGEPYTKYATIVCTQNDLRFALFNFPGFGENDLAWDEETQTGTPPGIYDLSFDLKYNETRHEAVNNMVRVYVHPKR